MRVALVTFGFGEYCVRLANALCAYTDCEVTLIGSRRRLGPFADRADVPVRVRLFDSPRLRQPARHLINARRLLRWINDVDPVVVHFQGAHLWFNWFLPAIRRRYPLLVTAHDVRLHLGDGASRKTPQFVLNYGYRTADHLIVHGERLREELHEYLGISPDRVSVTPMVPQGPKIHQVDASDHVAQEDHTLLFFGRIWPYKGLDVLIEAMPMVHARVPDVRVIIAGQGEDLARYRRMMHDSSIYEIHNEHVSDEDRDRFFARAAIVVLPYVEGSQSGVIPVAQAWGKPVVVSRVGAIAEAVEDGRTGLVVPPRDPQALAQAILRLLGDPAVRRCMGAAGKRRLVEQEREVAQLHRAAYQFAVERRNATAPNVSAESGYGRGG